MEIIPPQNIEAEQSLLGSVMIDNDIIKDVEKVINPSEFYESRNGVIYAHVHKLYSEGSPIDLITLSNSLNSSNLLSKVGGRTYLADLVAMVPTSTHAVKYANIIKEAYIRRSLMSAASKMTEMALDERKDLKGVLHASEDGIYKLSQLGLNRKPNDNLNQIDQYSMYKDEFKSLNNGDIMGMSTGIRKLDSATLGLIRNHIWVCGAYYGYGKTYFAINLINSVLEQGKKVMFFSLEMNSVEIIQRLVSLRAKLNLVETLGMLSEEKLIERTKAEEFIFNCIKTGKLIIEDSARDADEMISKMTIEDSKEHIDFVAIDYIQLLSGDDQYESLRNATKNLQCATKELHTTTLILSQINNESQREGDFSRVDGFKGAGDIGQIANVAIRIKRERDEKTGEFSPLYGLRLTKIRHGKPCSLKCEIQFPSGRIVDSIDETPVTEEISDSSDEVMKMWQDL